MSTLSFDEMFGLDDLPATKPTTSPSTSKPANQLAFFVEKYAPIARAAGERLGVEPELLLGQWGLETGWGRSVISDTHNLGNIKDFSGKGPKARDNMTGITDSYRPYESPEAFAEDFSNLIGNNKRYAAALGAGGDAKRYFAGLKQGGYAEDPAYVAKGTQAVNMVRRALGNVNPSAQTPKLTGEPASRSQQTQFAQSPMSDEELDDAFGLTRMAQPDAPMPERSFWQAGGDTALAAGQALIGLGKNITDLGGADNPASQVLDDAVKGTEKFKSDYAQRRNENSQRRIEDAQGEGVQAELKAYWDALWDAPIEMAASAAASYGPFGLIGRLAKGAQVIGLANAAKKAGVSKEVFMASPAGKLAMETITQAVNRGATAASTTLAAGLGVGGVKGQQYETTLREAKAAGKSDEEAKKLAVEAQAYGGPGTVNQVLGGALGVASVALGPVERALTKVKPAGAIATAQSAGRPFLARTGLGALKESVPEGLQDFQQPYAGNEAAISTGVMDPSRRFEGAFGQGMQSAVLAAPMGGVAGAMEPGPAKQNKPAQPQNRPAVSPAAPPAAQTPTGEVPPAPPSAAATTAAPASPLDLGDTEIDQAMAKLSDDELQAMMADVESHEDDATDEDWVNYSAAMAELDRRKASPTAPPAPVAQESSEEKQPALPENPALAAIDSEANQQPPAQDIASAPAPEAPANLFGEVQADEARTPFQEPSAEPVPAKPVDQMDEAELRERVAYISEQAKMNGGWSKPLIAERNKARKALQAISSKRAPEPQETVRQGDILNNVGLPFTSPKAAEIKAKKDNKGGQVAPVQGGFVVRMPQNMSGTPSATMGTRTDAKAGPGFTAADVVRRDPIAGQKINDEWTAFAPQSGTLGIPRAEMPQVKAGDRGAMVNFLRARGIDSSKEQLPPTALKPTQAEFSPAKVQEAADRTDGDRSIIVSADGYVVDGHHQWLAQRQKGEPVNVIRLGQPIAQVLDALKQMPSAQPEQSQDATLTNDGTMPAIDPSTLAAKQRWEQRQTEEKQQAAQNQQENERYNAYVQEQEKDAERRRLQGDNIIQQANGKPFKTEASAQAKLDEFDLADTHAIQKTDKGFVLRRMPPAEQAEQRRKAEGRESYMEAQAAVLAEMGIGETADGEIDATDEQFADIERRTAERLGRNAQPADSKPNQPPAQQAPAEVATENVANPAQPQKLPPTDIRVGDKVMVDGEPYTVTGPLKDGKKVVGVVASRDGDTNPLAGVRQVFLRGDEAIAARVAAQKAQAATESVAPEVGKTSPIADIDRKIAAYEKRLDAMRIKKTDEPYWSDQLANAELQIEQLQEQKRSIEQLEELTRKFKQETKERQDDLMDDPEMAAYENGLTAETRAQDAAKLAKAPPAPAKDKAPISKPDAAAALGVEFSESVKRALVAKAEGRVSEDVDQQKAGEFFHDGLKIYPVTINVGGEVKSMWAVQTLNNAEREANGERQLGGDPVSETIEGAKKLAESEIAAAKQLEEYRAAMAAMKAEKAAAEAARKEANRGKTLSEIKAQKYLDDPVVDGETGERMTRAEWIKRRVDAGDALDTWLENKIKDKSRREWDRMDNREQAAHEKKVIEGGQVSKYRIGDYNVTKTEYDYAQKLLVDKDGGTSTQPIASAADSQLEAIFAGLEADGLKKRKAEAALAERTDDAEVINQVEAQFYDVLTSLMDRGDLEINGHKTIHKDNESCL